jgi:hypothetical protein
MAIHYLKSRNSDYLAGTDLEIFELEGKSKSLTIKKVEYQENFKVNGKIKPKGLVANFHEEYANPLIINPTNARIIKSLTGIMDAEKWVGFTLTFWFDTKVEMKVSKTETIKGGIRVKSVNTNGLVAPLEDITARIEGCTNKAELMNIWQDLDEKQQIEYKNKFTEKLGKL